LAIPSTLQDSLMARLDRLAPVKETAQIGAAIGREFSQRLLKAVSPIMGTELKDALAQLAASQLLYRRGAPAEATYVFKHALVRDTAYSSMLRSRRQRIHADIARALVERFADQVESSSAIIAHHHTEAGLVEPAALYWIRAAELALAHSAYAEADRYVDAGLAVIPRLTDGPDRQSFELTLQVARANALLPLKGLAAPETVAALTEAQRFLDAGVGTDMQRSRVMEALCAAFYISGKCEPALVLAHRVVEIADRQDDTIYHMSGYRILGTVQLIVGLNRESLESLKHAEQYRDPIRDRLLSNRGGLDVGLNVLCWKSTALMYRGNFDQAAQVRQQMLFELSNHGSAITIAQCRLFAES
jgi:hypothetical protein